MSDSNALNKLNAVVWADIPVADLDRAMNFYSAVLARKISKVEMGMTFAVVDHHGGNGACLVPGAPSDQGPLLYFNVDGRLDAAQAAVAPHGGKVLEAKHSIGPHGFRAVIQDSEGNRIALHSN